LFCLRHGIFVHGAGGGGAEVLESAVGRARLVTERAERGGFTLDLAFSQK
jgi:hypothetical protein